MLFTKIRLWWNLHKYNWCRKQFRVFRKSLSFRIEISAFNKFEIWNVVQFLMNENYKNHSWNNADGKLNLHSEKKINLENQFFWSVHRDEIFDRLDIQMCVEIYCETYHKNVIKQLLIRSVTENQAKKVKQTWFVFPSASIVTGLETGGSSYIFKFSMMSLVCSIVDGQLWVAIRCGSFKYTTITDILSFDPCDFANWHSSDATER